MSDDLRTRMHHVADEITPLPVSDDLWRRGQAARHRAQALAVAAVLVVLASVGGGAALWSTSDREARTASGEVPGGGAIPSRIVDVPADLDVTTDLAVGRGSAAFISRDREPVVITAADGVAHRLELAGWASDADAPGTTRLNQALALSPDGARLAWQGADDESGRATINVLDLATGDASTYRPLPPDEGLRLREMSWSPDSSWLAWIADAPPTAWVGRLRPGPEPDSQAHRVRANVPDVAVDTLGTLVHGSAAGGLERIRSTGDTSPLTPGKDVDVTSLGAGRFSPDGRYLALRSSLDPVSYTFDTEDRKLLEHPFPDGTFEDGFVMPQGWLDDRLQLLLVQESSAPDRAELVVTTPRVGATSTWRRAVAVVDAGPAASLSLAVDLIPDLDGTSSQELTHDFDDPAEDPPTPLGIELSLFIGLSVAAAIALLLALRWLWRRVLS
ncbi:hypothetical protein GCM10009641_60620 [Mycobacterium cookii]|uniref:WD40 repeat domain-containing protein n=1 Tax=Nocardioides furvisabuli TaxID=375542 RepID=A0ABP5IVM4_9ACTN|nr:hypothetical protein [Nocardioides furvisabuli]